MVYIRPPDSSVCHWRGAMICEILRQYGNHGTAQPRRNGRCQNFLRLSFPNTSPNRAKWMFCTKPGLEKWRIFMKQPTGYGGDLEKTRLLLSLPCTASNSLIHRGMKPLLPSCSQLDSSKVRGLLSVRESRKAIHDRYKLSPYATSNTS